MISIIVPVYNAEKYLEQCVKSILNQNYSDFELLLIDDGSTDESAKICDSFIYDHRVRTFHRTNSGVSSSRNFGLDNAKGEYITFIDSDDWIEESYLSVLMQNLIENEVDISSCNCFVESATKKYVRGTYESKLLSNIDALNCYSKYYFSVVWGRIYKSSILKGIRFNENIYYSEDTLFYTEAAINSKILYFDSTPLYHYRINENSAMNKKFDLRKRITDFYARLEIVKEYESNQIDSSGAICRAYSSGLSILLRQDEMVEEIREILLYLKKNRKKFFLSKEVKLLTKIKSFIAYCRGMIKFLRK